VSFVAVNAKQAEDWDGASGRQFVEQHQRHERMLGPLTARLLAAGAPAMRTRCSPSGAPRPRRCSASASCLGAQHKPPSWPDRSGTAWWRTHRRLAWSCPARPG